MIVERDNFKIICGNNREHYGSIGEVQAVLTDPPYGDEVHSKERAARNAKGQITVVEIPFDKLSGEDTADLAAYCEVYCRGWLLVFCQHEQVSEWRAALESDMIRYNRPMVWIKPDAKPNFAGTGPGSGHETILSFWSRLDRPRWNGGGKVGVFYHTRNRRTDGSFKHPTEKPVSLMKELIRLFTNPGDTVFDPFMGGGSTGIAALELGRKFIGIEHNQSYFDEALKRLEDAARPTLYETPVPKIPTLFGDPEFQPRRRRERLGRAAAAKEKENADR